MNGMSPVHWNRLDIKYGGKGNEFKVRIDGIEFLLLLWICILELMKGFLGNTIGFLKQALQIVTFVILNKFPNYSKHLFLHLWKEET